MSPIGPVLVTGADQHQGLAVIRGLGRAGIPVIAAGNHSGCIGFASRYTTERRTYTSPFRDPDRFREEMLAMVAELRPQLIIPAVEGTLVLLNELREAFAPHTVLAAPEPDILDHVLDKGRTLELAERCGVPAPRTARGPGIERILGETTSFTFPVAVKPRGNPLHGSTAHALGFKSRYATSHSELRRLLAPFERDGDAILVQEFARGVGRCVAAVCDHGRPLALFAYERDRELPLTGGVSVRRRSIPLDHALRRHVTALLGAIGWHGVAMVEFKYDPWTDEYVLMEINGRFQASTALSLDAGLNLPHLVAALFTGAPLPEVRPYRVGVEERWLRGDILALIGAWRAADGPHLPGHRPPEDRWAATRDFLRDFRPGMCYDEFAWEDWKPGVVELVGMAVEALRWSAARGRGLYRRLTASPSITSLANLLTHRSIRA